RGRRRHDAGAGPDGTRLSARPPHAVPRRTDLDVLGQPLGDVQRAVRRGPGRPRPALGGLLRGPLRFAVVAILAGCSAGVVLPHGELLRDVFLRGSPATPTVALTFDDGPNGVCTAAVLDALHDLGAPATFFVLGANVARGQNDALLA